MPDFRDQLGRELRHAAERRWGERRRAISAGTVAAMAGAAVAIAIAVAVVLSLRPPGATQPAASPPTIPPAIPAGGCDPARTLPATATPSSLSRILAVLRRPQREPDGLPVLNAPGGGAGDEGWLPLTDIAFGGTRAVFRAPFVWLVPSHGVLRLGERQLTGRCPAAHHAPARPGACLVTGFAGGPLAWRCFVTKDIEEGRAAMTVRLRGARRSVVMVLVPDGVASVSGEPVRSNFAELPSGVTQVVMVPQARRVGPGIYSSLDVRATVCPRDALPLREGDLRRAAAAVKAVIRALVPRGGDPGIDTTGAIVRGFGSAGLDGAPAQADCGARARRRTAVVVARFPRVTFSASLSQAVYYVSRERRGWLVWGIGPG